MTNQEKREAKELLQALLRIPTVNSQDDEGALARYLAAYLRREGIDTQLTELDAKRCNLTAVLPGQTEETLLLCGHMDTVPAGNLDDWDTAPFEPAEAAGRMIARGASDMKSGLAAIAYALVRLARSGAAPHSRLVLAATADEEKTGLGARAFASAFDVSRAKALLIAEPTDCSIGIAQKGCLWLAVNTRGRTAHAAYQSEGVSAIEGAFAVARAAQSLLNGSADPLLGASSCVMTRMRAGVANNMVPDACEMLLDIRTVPGASHAQLLERLGAACKALECETSGLQIELEVQNDRMPIRVAQGDPVLERFGGIAARVSGRKAEHTGISFFTDASELVKACPQVPVLLYGPGEQRLAHQPNESVALERYLEAIEVYTEACRVL